MKITRVKRGPRGIGQEIIVDNITGDARYIISFTHKGKSFQREFHTSESDGLPMWDEHNLLDKGTTFPQFVIKDLSEHLDGQVQVFPIPNEVTAATAVSV